MRHPNDWERGVDLYADGPLIFEKLVYTMRFDEASPALLATGATQPVLR